MGGTNSRRATRQPFPACTSSGCKVPPKPPPRTRSVLAEFTRSQRHAHPPVHPARHNWRSGHAPAAPRGHVATSRRLRFRVGPHGVRCGRCRDYSDRWRSVSGVPRSLFCSARVWIWPDLIGVRLVRCCGSSGRRHAAPETALMTHTGHRSRQRSRSAGLGHIGVIDSSRKKRSVAAQGHPWGVDHEQAYISACFDCRCWDRVGASDACGRYRHRERIDAPIADRHGVRPG